MKHVNGDMEDLFRRAAAKYPLRTDSADWDRLAADLDRDPGPPSDPDAEEKRRRRGFFWWWLLLPLAGALGFYGWRATVRQPVHLSKAVITAPATMPDGKAVGSTSSGGAQADGSQGGSAHGDGGAQGGGTTAVAASSGGVQAGTTTPGGGTSTERTGATTSTGMGERVTRGGRSMGLQTTRNRPTGSTANAGRIHSGNRTSNDVFDATEAGGQTSSPTGGQTSTPTGVQAGRPTGGQTGTPTGGGDGRSMVNWRRAPTAGSFNLVVDVKAPAAAKDSSAKQTKKATAKSNRGHGYIGISGAPDLSTVKMQATKGVGTTWGLLLGYAFNSHWAVESGVYLDRKKYYSAGEYFKGPSLPPGETLQTVNGICNMWEVPLNVRYTFNPGSKTTWFATTGFSSYFMTKQQYAAQIEGTGGYPWPDSWNDSKHDNYLFSIINLSGGFEQRIGHIGNLRIEPYLRIPLSGIGEGRLPIMSAGLNIGITRQLW